MADKVPEHQPTGVRWTCRDCAEPWPCPPARERLSDELIKDRVVLTMYLASSFFRACSDMPDTPAGILYGRFLGWIQ